MVHWSSIGAVQQAQWFVECYSFTAPANDSERPIVREMTA